MTVRMAKVLNLHRTLPFWAPKTNNIFKDFFICFSNKIPDVIVSKVAAIIVSDLEVISVHLKSLTSYFENIELSKKNYSQIIPDCSYL